MRNQMMFPRLALEGMRKNRKMYLPYLFTCIGMVLMYYVMVFLQMDENVASLRGASLICEMLGLGSRVIAFFACLFLFYSHSFLMKRRKKEFGLYYVLGMEKRHISRILFWENLFTALIALGGGLLLGIAFSKCAELGMMNLIQSGISYRFTVPLKGIFQTLLIFAVIFLLLLLNAIRQIRFGTAMNLLRSENMGEKPPKGNWFLGLAGAVLLAAAYYMSVSIKNPVTALTRFFLAVLMVMAATYLLMISGSVLICNLLKKNKKYYYKKQHFVSVSSMAYRMKRNGAGLASICILATMVLVMLSSTVCLYAGTENSVRTRYPGEINLEYSTSVEGEIPSKDIEDQIQKVLDSHDARITEKNQYTAFYSAGVFKDGVLKDSRDAMESFGAMEQAALLYVIPISDYNQVMGTSESLEEDEVLICPFRTKYEAPSFQLEEGKRYQVKACTDQWVVSGDAASTTFSTLYVFVPDLETFMNSLETKATAENISAMQARSLEWNYNFDLNVAPSEQIAISEELENLTWEGVDESGETTMLVEGREAHRSSFYQLYGGLFFLGILLSIVFLLAAVLIIYYKQITEGYEDQSRFEIMQKVGMTKQEIRKNINSQILTVFYLPLLLAGLHLIFAFPIVRKLLQLFNMDNTPLFVGTCLFCFGIFALFYAIVYRITSNAYFAIVSGAKE